MTNQPSSDPSSTLDPLASDPLADDYGSVLEPARSGSAIPPAPSGSAIPPAPGTAPAPDPTSDRFSAFDEPASTPPPAPGRGKRKRNRSRSRSRSQGRTSVAPAPTASRPSRAASVGSSSGQGGSASSTPSGGPSGRRTSGVARGVIVVLGALVLLPVVVGFALSRVVGDSDRDGADGADPADRSLVATEVSVPSSSVAELPATVTSVRVEFQGPGRTADVRLYTPDGSSNLDNRVLPYALDVPVATDDAYLSVSADDYGYRGSQPMRCTISVGDTVLATAVGTQSVDCKVTDQTWSRVR